MVQVGEEPEEGEAEELAEVWGLVLEVNVSVQIVVIQYLTGVEYRAFRKNVLNAALQW